MQDLSVLCIIHLHMEIHCTLTLLFRHLGIICYIFTFFFFARYINIDTFLWAQYICWKLFVFGPSEVFSVVGWNMFKLCFVSQSCHDP